MNPLAILTLSGLVGGFCWLAMRSDDGLYWFGSICFASDCLSQIGRLLATGGQP